MTHLGIALLCYGLGASDPVVFLIGAGLLTKAKWDVIIRFLYERDARR